MAIEEDDRQAAAARQQVARESRVSVLYRDAFSRFRTRALWNLAELDRPSREQVLAVARQLRTEGDMNARCLAEEIEDAIRAAD